MGKYSDGEIRNCKKITLKITANYLGISPLAVGLGMRNDLLPNGFAVKNEERFSECRIYHIIDERLMAYKHGKITSIQVKNLEKTNNSE